MPIFQKSIVDKYLETLDEGIIDQAYASYREVYNPKKIQRIKKLKEEQYQAGFLNDIFGSVLGYTIDPEVGYNVELEKKNETDAKKADGAILKEENVLGVIELKSNKTKNLESIKDQAFGYKNNHKGCKYVISSNFHKLRFYVDDATEYEEFDLYNLDKETFARFYLYLRKEGLLDKSIPELLKKETKFHEENISKQLYKDYAAFKNKFFENIVRNNPQHDKLLLFKKSQKFLDRILFILFAEDKNLIPTNAISRIIESWALADDLHYKPLYELFTILFSHLNTGFKYKSGYEIPEYNGGLFAPDEVLDILRVDDEILKDDLLMLSKYDFNTDIDVNILGHIFEHSLSELEEVEAQLKGEEVDKSKGKRKKDGVFYTPKYITKYIVDNTVGKLCLEKKEELGLDKDIDIFDYQKTDGTPNVKGKGLFRTLETYKEWLLSLKILDPACGSGAFLNQALTYLITEHQFIDDLIAELTNSPLRIFDTDKAILENNIYGVDINEESVEIAKLSLWLRTAQKGRKLSNLSNNIECGNSLIDDPEVAGDKAFNWQKEFSGIFENGGFDVVIGNPPYVRHEQFGNLKSEFEKKYQVYNGIADLYVYFIERGFNLLKKNGLFSFIVANKWLSVTYAEQMRSWLMSRKIIELLDFGDLPVFADATAYPCILSMQNSGNLGTFRVAQIKHLQFDSLSIHASQNAFRVSQSQLTGDKWLLVDSQSSNLIDKLFKNGIPLHEYTGGVIRRGIVTGCNDAFVISEEIKEDLIKSDSNSAEIIKPFLGGRDVKKYNIKFGKKYIIFTRRGIEIEKYPAILNYLHQFQEILEPKPKGFKGSWRGRKPGSYKWYEIQDSIDYYRDFEKPKIIYPNICNGPEFAYDDAKYYSNQKCFIIPTDDKYLLGVLNSRVFYFLFRMILPKLRGGFYEPGYTYLKKFPIIKIDQNDVLYTKIVRSVELQLIMKSTLQKIKTSFSIQMISRCNLTKLSAKLEGWYDLETRQFLHEIKKSKIKLSLSEEAEWLQYFNEQKEKVQIQKLEIDKTDKEIDQVVYKLYGLKEEEIRIVERNDSISN